MTSAQKYLIQQNFMRIIGHMLSEMTEMELQLYVISCARKSPLLFLFNLLVGRAKMYYQIR